MLCVECCVGVLMVLRVLRGLCVEVIDGELFIHCSFFVWALLCCGMGGN